MRGFRARRGRERCSQFGLTEVGPAATESCDCFLLEAFEGTFPSLPPALNIRTCLSVQLSLVQTHLLYGLISFGQPYRVPHLPRKNWTESIRLQISLTAVSSVLPSAYYWLSLCLLSLVCVTFVELCIAKATSSLVPVLTEQR